MRIVQITDIHIGAEGEATRDVDVRTNFISVLEVATHLDPDYLVFSGDLCFDLADAGVYRWIKDRLDALNLPYEVIPGNHDDTALMAAVFERENLLLPSGEMAFARTIAGFQFLFLDTSRGTLSREQADWLRRILAQTTGTQVIFMHHPPGAVGVPFMDARYPMQTPEVFRQAVQGYPAPIHVFCGHYHAEKTVHEGLLHIHVTPSTFFQIVQFQEAFAVDHYRPAFRVIELFPGEEVNLRHTVRYLDVAGW